MFCVPKLHLALASIACVAVLGLSSCVSGAPEGDQSSEWENDVADFADDIKIIDRGLQEGRSMHSGWAAPNEYVVAEPFLSPWPGSFTRQELIDSALARTFEYFDKHAQHDAPSNLTVHFEDSFPEDHRSWVLDMANVAASFPAKYTTHHFDLMVGEPGWVYEVIEELGVWTPGSGHCGGLDPDGVVGGCASRGAVSANYGQTVESGELDWSGTLPSIVPHEMFHSVQDVLDPDPESGEMGYKFFRPLWFWEGGAEFFGYAVGDYAGVASYYVSPWEWWYYLPSPNVSLKDYSQRPSFAVPPEGYWKGQIATEYIVASLGVEGMLNISQALGEGLSWEDAFEVGTGMAMGEFYLVFDSAYEKMFYANTELKTHLSRECPGQWNCYVQREDPEFKRIQESKSYEVGDRQGILLEACRDFTEEEMAEVEWWVDCIETPFKLPETLELEEGEVTLWERTPGFDSCDELNGVGDRDIPYNGVAASSEVQENTGASEAYVNPLRYAKSHLLDTNQDGVLCNSQVPE